MPRSRSLGPRAVLACRHSLGELPPYLEERLRGWARPCRVARWPLSHSSTTITPRPEQAICGQADILRLQPVFPSTVRDGGNGRTRCRLEPRPGQVAGVSPRPPRRALAVVPHRRAGRSPRAVPSQAYASGTRLWRPEELTDPGRLPLARTLHGDGQTGIDHRWGLAVSRRARHRGEATGPALGASTTTAGRVRPAHRYALAVHGRHPPRTRHPRHSRLVARS